MDARVMPRISSSEMSRAAGAGVSTVTEAFLNRMGEAADIV